MVPKRLETSNRNADGDLPEMFLREMQFGFTWTHLRYVPLEKTPKIC